MLIALAVIRTLIGLFFAVEGVTGFTSRDAFAELFTHWHVPYPEFLVPIFAAIAVVCGVLLMIGWMVRPAALLLASIVVEMTITAGRVDGGVYMIVPPLLVAALAYYAWRSGRYAGWTPTRRPSTQ
jgi:uncharacterized membrane protein YphA (DoxX/SURF4 family)